MVAFPAPSVVLHPPKRATLALHYYYYFPLLLNDCYFCYWCLFNFSSSEDSPTTFNTRIVMSSLPIPFLEIPAATTRRAVSPLTPNVAMLMCVSKLLGDRLLQLGYLRSAGSDGANAFNELVNTPISPIPLCVELKSSDGSDSTQYIPLRLMQCSEENVEEYRHTVSNDVKSCACVPRNLSNNTVIISNTACTAIGEGMADT